MDIDRELEMARLLNSMPEDRFRAFLSLSNHRGQITTDAPSINNPIKHRRKRIKSRGPRTQIGAHIVNFLNSHRGAFTGVEISRQTGIPHPQITCRMHGLVQRGLIREGNFRKPSEYKPKTMIKTYQGVKSIGSFPPLNK